MSIVPQDPDSKPDAPPSDEDRRVCCPDCGGPDISSRNDRAAGFDGRCAGHGVYYDRGIDCRADKTGEGYRDLRGMSCSVPGCDYDSADTDGLRDGLLSWLLVFTGRDVDTTEADRTWLRNEVDDMLAGPLASVPRQRPLDGDA